MKILITGASGYIGRRLVKLATLNNHIVIATSRRSDALATNEFFFDFNSNAPLTLPADIEAVVHLAITTSASSDNDGHLEKAAAESLIAAAKDVNAKFIFISSQTSRPDAPTPYGRVKWQIEQQVLAADGWVVRLGLVYGGSEQGLFGKLVNLVRHLPVLPAFMPAPLVQPIHVDDCANGLLKLVTCNDIPSGILCLATPEPISFSYFLSSIALYRVRRHAFYILTPVIFIQIGMKLLGDKINSKIGLYQLNSLFELPTMSTKTDLETLGLELRPLNSGMHRSGNNRRRNLIQEGTAILTYLLKEKPKSQLVRRYVYSVEKLRTGFPLILPSWLLRWPLTFALLDTHVFTTSLPSEEFQWRINAAMLIAEASKEGAARFLGNSQSNQRLKALVKMTLAVGSELTWRTLGFICIPLLRIYMQRHKDSV